MLLIPLLNRTGSRIKTWIEVSRQRRELAGLSDQILKDIGLSRVDAEQEAKRPFWDQGCRQDLTLHERSQPSCVGSTKAEFKYCRQV